MSDDVVVRDEKKSTLFDPIFKKLPYPIASGIVRGIRAFFAIVMPILITGIADGSLLEGKFTIDPKLTAVAVLTPIILGVDKWLREKGLEDDTSDTPISLIGSGPTDDDTSANTPN